jgi:hypothetical protein
MHHHWHHSRAYGGGYYNPLSPQGMMAFTSTLAGLPPDEVRKAKRLYLLDALTAFEARQRSYAAFAVLQLLFAVIPCFWPILLVQVLMINSSRNASRQMIANALEVWRDDLEYEYEDFRNRLYAATAPSWVTFMPLIGLGVFGVLAALFMLVSLLAR